MSEAPQQHGWQPPDSDEADKAQSQRGFGLFEAPDAPDEFPVFTPFHQVAQKADDFPPDSTHDEKAESAFPGFPSDEPPYVPAPAAMPIPGVAHDAFATEPPPAPPAPQQPEVPELPEPSTGPAGTWSAFAAGDAPKQPPTPPPWEAPESLTTPEPPPFPGFEPSHAPAQPAAEHSPPSLHGFEPAHTGVEEAAQAESQQQPPSFSGFDHAPPPAMADEPAPAFSHSDPDQAPISFHAPAVSHAEPDQAPISFHAPAVSHAEQDQAPAAFRAPEPEPDPAPVAPARQEEPAAAAPVRAAAAAPVANRLAPDEVPAAMPKPTGRVYGSAAAASAPVTPVTPSPPVSPAVPDTPAAEPATLPVRATARPVHVAQPDPGDMVPTGRSSTIYGSPANAAAPATAAPPARLGRAHAYGDLLEQQAGPAVQAAAAPTSQPPLVPAQRAPQQAPMPAPMPAPQATPLAPQPAPPGMPPRDSQQTRFDQFGPQQPPPGPEPAGQPMPERKGRMIVGVLAGCAALLAIAFGGLLLIDKLVAGPTFKVGDCVKQIGQEGVEKANCTDAGAFHIVASVADKKECDQTQPFVQQADKFFCLKPAAAQPNNETPQPQASASP